MLRKNRTDCQIFADFFEVRAGRSSRFRFPFRTPDGLPARTRRRPRRLGGAPDARRDGSRARHRQPDLHLDPQQQAAGSAARPRAAARHRSRAGDAARAARHRRMGRAPDRARVHAVRSCVLVARRDPVVRRPVPRLEGDARDPPSRVARRRRSGCAGRRRRPDDVGGGRPDPDARPGVLDRQHRDRDRHDPPCSDHVRRGDRRSERDAVRRAAARAFHRPQSERRDAGVELPHRDRHDAGRRGFRLARAEGLHLRGDGVLGVRRRDEHAGAAGEEAARPCGPECR